MKIFPKPLETLKEVFVSGMESPFAVRIDSVHTESGNLGAWAYGQTVELYSQSPHPKDCNCPSYCSSGMRYRGEEHKQAPSKLMQMRFEEMPGCCGVMVLTGFQKLEQTAKGTLEWALKHAETAMKASGYTLLMASTAKELNPKAEHVLAKMGWEPKVSDAKSARTDNHLTVWTKRIA